MATNLELALGVGEQQQHRAPAGFLHRIQAGEHVSRLLHLLLGDLDDHVARFHRFLRGGAVGLDLGDDHALDRPADAVLAAEILGERRDGEAEQLLVLRRVALSLAFSLLVVLARVGGFLALGQPADRHVDIDGLALAQQPDRDALADWARRHRARQAAHVLDGLAVESENHVARLDAGGGGRAIRRDGGHQRAFRLLQTEALGDLVGHVLHVHAEPAAPRLAILLELIDHLHRAVRRHGEADADRAAGRRDDRRVHADHLPVHVEQRSARIAAIDGGVGLEEIVIGPGIDVALGGGDDADGDAAAEAERIADRHHPVADPHLAGIAEGDGVQRLLGLDLEQREIGLGVMAEDLGHLQLGAVGEVDDDLVGAFDDVVVGDDQAGRIDDKARAERAYLARQTVFLLVVEEIVEELLERRALGPGTGRGAVLGALQRLGGRDIDHSVLKPLGDVGHGVGAARQACGGEQRRRAGEQQHEARRRQTGALDDGR